MAEIENHIPQNLGRLTVNGKIMNYLPTARGDFGANFTHTDQNRINALKEAIKLCQ